VRPLRQQHGVLPAVHAEAADVCPAPGPVATQRGGQPQEALRVHGELRGVRVVVVVVPVRLLVLRVALPVRLVRVEVGVFELVPVAEPAGVRGQGLRRVRLCLELSKHDLWGSKGSERGHIKLMEGSYRRSHVGVI
jgi:hypothetical protein